MKRSRLAHVVLVAGMVTFASGDVCLAQDLDQKWLLGTWKGTSPSPAGGVDSREILFKEDGMFTGKVHSVRGGLIYVSGSYKISGAEVTLEGVYEAPRVRDVHGTKFTNSLKRKGEDLEGTGVSHWNNRTFPVSLKRAM